MKSRRPILTAIMGPTASGKSDLAESLADARGARLVNADAFQVYRGFDIGTGKSDRKSEYDLIDILEPHESFGVGEWVKRVLAILEEAFASDQDVVIVGGTGLYIRALLEGYELMDGPPDPALREQVNQWFDLEGLEGIVGRLKSRDPQVAERIDLLNPARVKRALERTFTTSLERVNVSVPNFCTLKVGLHVPPAVLVSQIEARVHRMVHNGWVREVEDLLKRGVLESMPAMRAIGYYSLSQYINGEVSLDSAVEEIIRETRRYAKRQRTWLRSEPNLVWLESVGTEDRREQILQWFDLKCLED